MKKLISILVVLSLLFSFAACSSGNTEENTSSSADVDNDIPVISLHSDKSEVSAGDIISIYVHIKNAIHTACFDVYVYADEKLEYELATAQALSPEFILAANYLEDENNGYVAIRGIIATAYDIPDNDIYKIDYKVSDEVKSGDKLTFTVDSPSFELALDASGNDIYSVSEYLQVNNLTVNVK